MKVVREGERVGQPEIDGPTAIEEIRPLAALNALVPSCQA
jgi:hypothetical protein